MSSSSFVKNITGVETFNPDILETIADLSNDEVFTPPQVANDMLDALPEEVWHNPHLKWLDPSVKTGVFLREAAKRLLEGLKEPATEDTVLAARLREDEAYRRYWIYKNMLFGLAITDLTALMSRRSLYYSKFAANPELSVYPMDTDDGNILFKNIKHTYAKDKNGKLTGNCTLCGASLEWNRSEELESHAYPMIHATQEAIIEWFKEVNSDIKDEVNMKFDVIIGNPPYQLADGSGVEGSVSGASPIYNKFIEKSISFDPSYVCMITPSRWFQGGKGLDSFREKMLHDKRISSVVDFPDSSEVFPSVIIGGGVNYFLWDANYSGKCKFTLSLKGKIQTSTRDLSEFDKFIREEEGVALINKVTKIGDFKSLSEKVSSQKPFGLRTNFKDFDATHAAGKLKIYANRAVGYVDETKVPKFHESFEKYKVVVTRAYNIGFAPRLVTSPPLLLEPKDICTETYLVLNWFDSKQEAENMLAYAKTKFFRYMLSLLKTTQDISQDRFKYVPDLDMKQKWDDAKLYEHFGLTDEEIAHIDESIRDMV